MSVFVNATDEFTISLVTGKSKSRPDWVLADVSEEMLKEVYAGDLENTEEHKVTFRVPTFADSIMDSGVTVDNDIVSVNPTAIRAERLCRLLKSWTFKDKAGNLVPASKSNVMNLHPLVSSIILIQLDTALKERGLG